MKNDRLSRQLIAAVIVCMAVLALLSYFLPATLAAYMFPGISGISAVEPGKRQQLTLAPPGFALATVSTDRTACPHCAPPNGHSKRPSGTNNFI